MQWRNSVAVTADEALELNVIDLIAENRNELLAAIEGRVVEVLGEERALSLAHSTPVPVEMTIFQHFFDFLMDPNLAILLFVIAAAGLYLEFQSPGVIIPGAIGVTALLLLGFTMHLLPFSWMGAFILLAGIALLIAEIFVVSFGTLFVAGVTCFLIGGMMIFDRPDVWDLRVSFWEVLVPIVAALSVIGAFIAYSVGRTILTAQKAGVDEMIGMVGKCAGALDPEGRVFIRGEYWSSILVDHEAGDSALATGDVVEVVAVNGLKLQVRRAQQNT